MKDKNTIALKTCFVITGTTDKKQRKMNELNNQRTATLQQRQGEPFGFKLRRATGKNSYDHKLIISSIVENGTELFDLNHFCFEQIYVKNLLIFIPKIRIQQSLSV